ncbi:phage N-6-adenine-methyltransferase [Citrobacter braakii]|uniref:DNA (cytosine-5-)-methyltransferase n=2 Tax=Enterobacteriaceae TaxID=543 RepID=A0ABR6TRH7_CITBR|nr:MULTISPECIES: phage N-6-adenine-methyltransferase [Citrobacter]MBC2609389.1 phage N-6-adenine-methyltransferase [Citrobacter braakii]MBC2633429.1 phage N-6-adenine-methyltransferase [Citrobacter braakii]MBC2646148.1 phage N-6-adenine-methyltransferase [Citrobacter braakii]MDM3428892.1 phage N-6-adenine-methyltransferase [Citrobacter sp. Cb023]MDM3434956.1 phage N-6-adenine-methyltransferase [Citrobacter sp. Cb034]
MKYGSVCSGIEAASKAWEPIGWKPAWFSEIEPFPSAVLAHHWPEVTNLGDMTKIADAVRAGEVEAPDVLVGGTPCQAFSIAGLREGLSDDRGQLTLSYVELANAIDANRRERGEPESIIVWENVPGVLSSKDNAFGFFLAGLAGESSELQPAGGKWTHAGCVSGPERVIAWRVLDAQFFGVAQRRRRVFVVASARKGFDPAAVLFELDSVRRDSAPRRESQPEIARNAGERTKVGSHWDNPANPHPTLNQSNNIGGIGASNQELFSQRGSGLVSDSYSDVSRTLLAKENDSTAEDLETYVVHGTQDPDINRELAHTLGRNNGQENACIAFSYKDNGADATSDLSPTVRSGNHDKSHANSGQPPAICIQHASIGRHDAAGPQGKGYQEDVAFTQDSLSSADVVQYGMQVRRLTPIECERLQGFPDNHTLIGWRGKDAAECPDGPRYKAIGNSMAVPVMRWIGERIAATLPTEKLNGDYGGSKTPLDQRDLWRTPPALFAALDAEFCFQLDAAAAPHNALCRKFITAEQNTLETSWADYLNVPGYVWLNPPYSDITPFVKKAAAESRNQIGTVMLVPADTSVGWFKEAIQTASEVRFITAGRLAFINPVTGKPVSGNNKGSMLIIWHPYPRTHCHFATVERDELMTFGAKLLARREAA